MTSLFIGDSITEGFPVQELLPDRQIINRGISGTTSGEILKYLSPEWLKEDPGQIFVCLGTNDLARVVADDAILANLSDIIEKTQALSSQKDLRFYLTSLFPTRNNALRPNKRIYHLNTRIHLLAEYHQQQYLHLNVFFRDETGRLQTSLTNDGLHLNQAGYELWAGLIGQLV